VGTSSPNNTTQIEGETTTRADSGNFMMLLLPKPVKEVTYSNSSAKDLLNATFNTQIEQKLTKIELNQSDISKTPKKQPKSSHIFFPHEKLLDNKPEDVKNS
jgi:hypothetical protein